MKPYEKLLRIIRVQMPDAKEYDDIDLAAGISSYCAQWHGGQASDAYAIGSGLWADAHNLPTGDIDPNDWPGGHWTEYWLRENDHANARKYFPACLS